ncbi:MAG: 2,3-bisphosphoglycerate-independent phosphoglycerate mutase [bacterium]
MQRKPKKPVALIILDGWGAASKGKGNAVALANTPNLDNFFKKFPCGEIIAHGEAVGLEKDETSGSETAHENLGAGRIVIQDSRRISESIHDLSFFSNSALLGAIENLKNKKNSLHLMGLLSGNNSPHSKIWHLKALLELAKRHHTEKVFLHLFTDGRDSCPKSAKSFVEEIENYMKKLGTGEVATIGGRLYGMDRAKRWERLIKAYDAITLGKGEFAENALEAIEKAYKKGSADEFILPTVILKNKKPVAKIKDGDSVIFFHFRSDRARNFTKLFVSDDIENAKRKKKLKDLFFVAFTDFGPDLSVRTAFPSLPVKNSLPFALKELRQLYIAEMEKFAHITYFFNGGYANPVANEARIVVQSDSVENYKDNPQMSAKELADVITSNIKFDVYDFIAVNFANLDMVGHTGCIAAAKKAAEEVDLQAGKIVEAILEKDGTAIIVGDHGNAEEMLDKNGKISTCHSKNPVPVILINKKWKDKKMKMDRGLLSDIAPTIIDLFGVKQPKEMTGKSLLKLIG